MPFRLRHQQHEFELAAGEFLIGRSAECQLALDDALVSRRHAVLLVAPDALVVKDLGSRNGVIVNGMKIDQSRILLDGDKIVIGSQEMYISGSGAQRLEKVHRGRPRIGVQTLTSVGAAPKHAAPGPVPAQPKDTPPKRVDSFPLLATLADKALALGRSDDAERILSSVMAELLRNVQSGNPGSSETVEQAGHYAVRLAGATGKGAWVDYVVALYAAARRPCPAAIVDELHVVVRKTSAVDIVAFRAYLDVLRERSATLGPAERFLVQRIEGLERLAALR